MLFRPMQMATMVLLVADGRFWSGGVRVYLCTSFRIPVTPASRVWECFCFVETKVSPGTKLINILYKNKMRQSDIF